MTLETQNPVSPTPDPETQIPESNEILEENEIPESNGIPEENEIPESNENAESNEIPEENESREGLCPYFVRERSPGILSCECARMKFPDRYSRREVVYRYCAHPDGYKACMLKQALDHYYERKYAKHE